MGLITRPFNLDADLAAIGNLTGTNVFPARTGDGTWTTYKMTDWTSYTPTVTLVGGAGNTTPVYTTNNGDYTQIANNCLTIIYLTGDGGDEGAGTGVINVALGITASASMRPGYVPVGTYINGAVFGILYGSISASGTTISLSRQNVAARADLTGADQNNTTRTIMAAFSYRV